MTEIKRFWEWRKTKIKENPTWSGEAMTFFVDLYMQTYPGRRFQLVLQLFERIGELEQEQRGDRKTIEELEEELKKHECS